MTNYDTNIELISMYCMFQACMSLSAKVAGVLEIQKPDQNPDKPVKWVSSST